MENNTLTEQLKTSLENNRVKTRPTNNKFSGITPTPTKKTLITNAAKNINALEYATRQNLGNLMYISGCTVSNVDLFTTV